MTVTAETFGLQSFLRVASEHGDTAESVARWAWENVPSEHRDALAISALATCVSGLGSGERAKLRNGARSPSSRWADAGAIYKKYLSTTVNVGDGKYKVFGDCDRDDVFHAASIRFELAENTKREGLRFKAFHDAMVAHEVDLVSDLPEVVVVEIIRSNP